MRGAGSIPVLGTKSVWCPGNLKYECVLLTEQEVREQTLEKVLVHVRRPEGWA